MTQRITGGMLQRSILADLNKASSRLSGTQARLSSGKALTRTSDDVAAGSKALLLREGLKGTEQHQRNVGSALDWTNSTEAALSSMTDVVQRVRELVVQGGNDSIDGTSRAAIAAEVDQLAESLKGEANTSVAGRFLFSGTATSTPPYGAGDTFQGTTDPMAREIGPGVSVTINVNAADILGNGQASGDGKLLHVLRDISDHLRAGDGASLRSTDLERLDKGLDGVANVRALNGALTNRLESAASRLDVLEELGTKGLSDVEDADLARTVIDLNSQTAAYQAALRAGANLVQSSLMDFLR